MRSRVHYAWVVVGVGFVALVMSAGFRSTAGVLLLPLHDEFGWSHETIGLAVSLNLLCFGLGAPFAAALVERLGMRRVVGGALAVIAVSSLLTTGMTEPWQLFLLWGVVNGLATGAVSVPLAAIIANRWFVERRGLVTGVLTASNASGQLVFLPLLAWVASMDWRYAALLVAVAALGFVLPLVLLFMRDRPRDVGARPFGAPPDWEEPPAAPPALSAVLNGLRAGARSRTFWLLAGTFFVCGATTNGLVSTHLIPAAHDHGIAQVSAAALLALIGAFDIAGTVGSGLADRPLRPSEAPARLLRLPRPRAPRPAHGLRVPVRGARRLCGRVRARLGRHGATDVRPRHVRVPHPVGRRFRVDLQRSPARRGDRRMGRGANENGDRRVHDRVRRSGRPRPRGGARGSLDQKGAAPAAGRGSGDGLK